MGGYWLIGRYQHYELKKEMQERINTSASLKEKERFTFTLKNGQPSEASFSWEDEDEFYYNGEMYDVVEKKMANGSLYITCINDSKENILVNQLAEIAKKQNNNSNKPGSSIQLLLSLEFVSPGSAAISSLFILKELPVDKYKTSLRQICREIITPPPQA